MPGFVAGAAVTMSRQPGPCGLVNSPWWCGSTQSEKERFMPPTRIPGMAWNPLLRGCSSASLWFCEINRTLSTNFFSVHLLILQVRESLKSAPQEGAQARGAQRQVTAAFLFNWAACFSAGNPALVVAGLANSTLVVVWGCKLNQHQKVPGDEVCVWSAKCIIAQKKIDFVLQQIQRRDRRPRLSKCVLRVFGILVTQTKPFHAYLKL